MYVQQMNNAQNLTSEIFGGLATCKRVRTQADLRKNKKKTNSKVSKFCIDAEINVKVDDIAMASGEGNSTKLPSEEKESEKDPVIKDATAANANTANLDVDDDKGDDLVIDEQNDAEKSDEGESDEKEFEPTLDMMMNDFDDEQTMEEEGEFQF